MKLAGFKGILLFATTSLSLGCSTTPDTAMSDRYESIDYEKSGVDLSDYRTVMFGSLEIELPDQNRDPDNATEQRLRKEFRRALFLELQRSTTGLNNRYVDRPGRKTLLVKPRLGVERTVSVDSPAVTSNSATGSLQVDGSLTLQISLLDSLSGELLIRAAGTQSRSRSTDSDSVDWVEVSIVADTWAKAVVDFLDEHLSR